MNQTDYTASMILSCALEGGIGYWSLADDLTYDEAGEYTGVTLYRLSDGLVDPDLDEVIEQRSVFGVTYYDAKPMRVELADVTKAMRRIVFEDVKHANDAYLKSLCSALLFQGIDEVDYDSEDADRIVQVAVFGEVVYG